MNVQRALFFVDRISTWTGKLFSWLVVGLMLVVCIEVFKRYILNAPTAFIFDVNNFFYGSLFMLCGAYTLAQDGHVRGDFLYGNFKPRTQASLDLALYFLFFIPGILALVYSGWDYAITSWKIDEHSNVTANGPPIYHFKTVIPVAGVLVFIQGIAEIVRCVVCLKTGYWPERLKDVEEIDVVGEQLAQSEFVDEESRRMAMEKAKEIDDAAKARGVSDNIEIQREAKKE
jgi:TRAP-type mannitol/chloroaromatic compound transport system permease small subunit